jgi:putative pyruvate formate lyase activating enzyme
MVLVMPELSTRDRIRNCQPRYITAYRSGLLESKISVAERMLKNCRFCPGKCEVNRYKERGKICNTGIYPLVSNSFPHFGEESCLVGVRGSGTIFFCSCNLRCVFCQNYDISHSLNGSEITPFELAKIMIDLQNRGCHNINFVTPSHNIAPILKAVYLATEMGLNIPLVYNTSTYDSLESLDLLDGIIDIYMPDFKFWDRKSAKRYMNAQDYPLIAQRNLKIMYKQVGDLLVNDQQIALKGLLVRHLVLPGHIKDTRQIAHFLAQHISPRTALNIMFQYHPAGKVNMERFKELNRSISLQERNEAIQLKREAGLPNYAWI